MMNKSILFAVLTTVLLTSCGEPEASSQAVPVAGQESTIQEFKFENLLRDTLALAEGVEIIMSYVEIPKGTTLPTHYHPGEEFAYILEGSGELLLKDQNKISLKAGDAGKVPMKHTHSFSTQDEGARLVLFRVHEKGQPERIMVEE